VCTDWAGLDEEEYKDACDSLGTALGHVFPVELGLLLCNPEAAPPTAPHPAEEDTAPPPAPASPEHLRPSSPPPEPHALCAISSATASDFNYGDNQTRARREMRRLLGHSGEWELRSQVSSWVTLRARRVTLRARWVTLIHRWVTLRARCVTLRARWVALRARGATPRARWVTLRARWVALRAHWVTLRARCDNLV
jgi:hypothetical protein